MKENSRSRQRERDIQDSSPKVSVIIPTFNRASILSRAVKSVLAQTYRNFELILVDDASSDDTEQVIRDFVDERITYYRHDHNGGASAARNTGLNNIRGEYVAFLDDDDEWLPSKLAEQVRVLETAPPEVGMIYCWMDYFDTEGRLIAEVHPTLRGYVFEQILDRQRLAGCPTLLVRASVVKEIGGFDERLRRGNDGDFIRRVCLKYQVDVVPKVLVRVHEGHGAQISERTRRSTLADFTACQVRLEKFSEQFQERPKARATVLRRMAWDQAKLGQRGAAWSTMARALRLDPVNGKSVVDLIRLIRVRPE